MGSDEVGVGGRWGGKGGWFGSRERDREEEGREVSWGIGVCSGGRSLGKERRMLLVGKKEECCS
jgi:hypothetical protein